MNSAEPTGQLAAVTPAANTDAALPGAVAPSTVGAAPPVAVAPPDATPLRELVGCAPAGWRVFGKLELTNPTGSIKDRVAGPMLDAALASGRLRPGMTVVEASSGNTAIALGAAAAPRGVGVLAMAPRTMSPEKHRLHERYGVAVRAFDAAPLDARVNPRREAARELAEAEPQRYCTLDQFANTANARAHETATGPEIVRQLEAELGPDGELGWFVAGAGTGGSLSGIARALRRSRVGRRTRVMLVDPTGSALCDAFHSRAVGPGRVPAPDGIGERFWPPNLDRALIDRAVTLDRAEALAAAGRLHRETGVLAGPCAGYSLAGASRLWSSAAESGRPGADTDGGDRPRTVLMIVCDRGENYLSDPGFAAAVGLEGPSAGAG